MNEVIALLQYVGRFTICIRMFQDVLMKVEYFRKFAVFQDKSFSIEFLRNITRVTESMVNYNLCLCTQARNRCCDWRIFPLKNSSHSSDYCQFTTLSSVYSDNQFTSSSICSKIALLLSLNHWTHFETTWWIIFLVCNAQSTHGTFLFSVTTQRILYAKSLCISQSTRNQSIPPDTTMASHILPHTNLVNCWLNLPG